MKIGTGGEAAMTVMPSDQGTANRLMLALGGIVIHFGEFEVARQGAILAVYEQRLSGERSTKMRLPSDNFSQGTNYMRSSVTFDGMGLFAVDISRIMDTADRLAEKRNYIVHGYIAQFDEETQTALFRKFNVDRDDGTTYVSSPLEMTITELEALRDEAAPMAAEMADLADRLVDAFLGDTESA